MAVKHRSGIASLQIVADGDGLTSRAGTAVVVGMADRLGLTGVLSGVLGDGREWQGRHDPGRVARDPTLTMADGGDCFRDLGALRDQHVLFGPVCSDATAWRLVAALTEDRLDAIRHARASVRPQARPPGSRPRHPSPAIGPR